MIDQLVSVLFVSFRPEVQLPCPSQPLLRSLNFYIVICRIDKNLVSISYFSQDKVAVYDRFIFSVKGVIITDITVNIKRV